MKTRDHEHVWTKKDEIVISYLYKYGMNDLIFQPEKIAKLIGTTIGSIKMKIKNYKSLNEYDCGLEHSTKLSKEVNETMKNISQSTHRKVVVDILMKMA